MILAIETDAISPSPELLAIGVKCGGQKRLWKLWEHETEDAMVRDFVGWFLKNGEKVVIGFNHLKFDLPVLLLKARGLPDFERFFGRLNKANLEDLFTVLTFLNGGRIKGLKEHCRDLDVAWPAILDSKPAALYAAKNFGALEEYSLARLDAIEELKKKAWAAHNR